jgi:hypothetical protein
MEDDAVDITPEEPSFACTYALPYSCLDAFCILLLAALVIDLCCVPCVLAPWSHQLGHAVDFNNVVLYFPCAIYHACLAAQLGCLGKSVATTVAVFVIILQLYLVQTQVRPTPLPSSKAIKLPYCHTLPPDQGDGKFAFLWRPPLRLSRVRLNEQYCTLLLHKRAIVITRNTGKRVSS